MPPDRVIADPQNGRDALAGGHQVVFRDTEPGAAGGVQRGCQQRLHGKGPVPVARGIAPRQILSLPGGPLAQLSLSGLRSLFGQRGAQRIRCHTGGDIALNDTTLLSPADFPILNRSVGKHLIVTDKDLFTARNISIESIRILGGAFPGKVITYAGSVIVSSGSCLAPVFTDLMQRNDCALMPLEDFACNESGGLTAIINGEEVLVGSSAFMNLRGVRLTEARSMKDAVYVSINGLLVGFFKIKYVPVQSVQNALFALLRTKIAPIFAVRDFNITPLMLGQKFKMSTDGFDFPAYRKRYAMSAAEPSDYTQTAGIVARDGLGPLVSVAALGRQLYSTVRICVILALLCTVIGVVLMFALCAISAFDSATVDNLLVYMGLWLVPVILLNFSLKR